MSFYVCFLSETGRTLQEQNIRQNRKKGQDYENIKERLLAKGKPKKLALVAVANKLIKQVFTIATGNTQYRENYSKNICL